MTRWLEALKTFNADWNDLPRRLLWIVVLIGCLLLALVAFPYVAPFVFAALLASIIDPVVRRVTRLLGGSKVARGITSAVFVVLITSVVVFLVLVLLGRLISEGRTLAMTLPKIVGDLTGEAVAWVDGLELEWPILEGGLEEALTRMVADIASMLTSLASRAATFVARGALRAASMLPQLVLFAVMLLMGTFYMSADKERILAYLRGLLPEKHRTRTKAFQTSILRVILTQLRAGFIMLLVTFTELTIGFLIIGLDYAVLLALVIAALDALPVIGAGLFLIPMALYGLIFGIPRLAIGAALIYIGTIVVRQLLEPRIIGRQLGLYPLATMMAMYAGLRMMGFLGMILGPLVLLLCKVALAADPEGQAAPAKPVRPPRK